MDDEGDVLMTRLTPFTFMCSDGVARTWYAPTYDLALEYGRAWCRARGGLTVQEGS